MVVFVTMKSVTTLLALLIHPLLNAQVLPSDTIGFITDSLPETVNRFSISLIHREKNNKTAELTIDRIFGVEIDSVFYRGEVVQLVDSLITFHAYFADGKSNDSVYRFLLDSVTNIGYYFAQNPDRFFSKRVRNQPKYEEEIDGFLRTSQYLMVASLSYTLIDGTINFSNNTISDPTFLKIGIANLLVNAAYASFTIIRQFSTITYYNLEYDWQIVPD